MTNKRNRNKPRAGSGESTHHPHEPEDAVGGAAGGTSSSGPEQQQEEATRTKKNQDRKKRRKAAKHNKGKLQLDVGVDTLLYNSVNKQGELEIVQLMEYLVEDALQIYKDLGKRTYRVPSSYINSGKDSEEYVSNYKPAQECDYRSDRAESFVGDCLERLSEEVFLYTAVGPFFIITSYQYQHYLYRLKEFYKTHPQMTGSALVDIAPSGEAPTPVDETRTSPSPETSTDQATATQGATKSEKKKGRGEIDVMVLCRNHIVFVEIKAVGDNLKEHEDSEKSVFEKLKALHVQLLNDLRVFSNVMEGVLCQSGRAVCEGAGQLRKSLVAVVPNLHRSLVDECFRKNPSLEAEYKTAGILILTKDEMPPDRNNMKEGFDRFSQWWKEKVFPYAMQDGSLLPMGMEACTLQDDGGASGGVAADEGAAAGASLTEILNKRLAKLDKPLQVMAIIVGRYLGLLSVVQVSKTTELSPHRVEARSEGQTIWYIGQRFSAIVLTHIQRSYVDKDCPYGYLYGPPGSGKTVVLAVRARKWIEHYRNFVVIINMYRGCHTGRVIGRHMCKTVTYNLSAKDGENLQNHCLEFTVDVDTCSAADLARLKQGMLAQFGSDLGEEGSRLLFIVDETYVKDYWSSVYDALRENFKRSSMWCAGLFGKEPEGFQAFPLKRVMRCPPAIQRVLYLIDWKEERKDCYERDKDSSQVPSSGPSVITVRHHLCHEPYSSLHPSQCQKCGRELADILENLDVEKPATPHERLDKKDWTLRCSDIIFLVGMPRSWHRQDKHGNLDITTTAYQKYMKSYETCPMLQEIERRGYPFKVHTDVSCPGLLSRGASSGDGTPCSDPSCKAPADGDNQRINVTWVYTYQGMENKVIVFLPGDHAKPPGDDIPEEWTSSQLNIPCPGLLNDQEESGEATAAEPQAMPARADTSGAEDGSSDEFETSESDTDNEATDSKVLGKKKALRFKTSERNFRDEDSEVFGRWDLNNLLIAGSRSTSLLIIVTCGRCPSKHVTPP